MTTDDDPAPQLVTYPQFAIPQGLAVGLQISARCCVWGMRGCTAPLRGPLDADPSAIASMLLRTTVVVSAGAVLTVLCLVVGRGYVQSRTRRAMFLQRLWPALGCSRSSGS